jgi:penicillin-binding protein 1A
MLGTGLGVAVAAAIHMPRVEALADRTPSIITRLYDRHGEVFESYAKERRMLIEGEVPALLQDALLAAEDANFFQHGGVDATGAVRAAILNATRGGRTWGGSTLTMQLARQLYLSPAKTWRRKIEESFLAVEIEKRFSKQQILTMYSNLVNVGHGNYGMRSAARYYFDKEIDELNAPETAMLVGIVQRPSSYSPYRKPDVVRARRDYVLRRMHEEGTLSATELEEALAQPLGVVQRRQQDREAPYFAEEIRKYLESQYGTSALLEEGLQTHTTLDPAIQGAAEAALRDGLVALDQRKGWRGPVRQLPEEEIESAELPGWIELDVEDGKWFEGLVLDSDRQTATVKVGEETFDLDASGIEWTYRKEPRSLLKRGDVAWFRWGVRGSDEDEVPRLLLEQEPEIDGAVVVLESSTGAVRALVGGWDFGRSQFNRATQAHRQVGSTFKPVVFGAALEVGFTPADTIFDAPVVFPGTDAEILDYSPRNYYREYYGILTLRRALEDSRNVSSVKLFDLVGAARVVDFARRAGIESPLPPYPSLALGSADLTPLELASAYATIANSGVHMEPYLIERVTRPDGRVLEQHTPHASKATEPEIARVLTGMLEGVIDRGTGKAARFLDVDLAGKTGTTDRFTDAWFAGFTPSLTIVAWVGYDVQQPLGPRMTGAVAALPIWQAVVERGLNEGWIPVGDEFPNAPGVVRVPVEYYSGRLPGPGATHTITETFVTGTQPALRFEPEWKEIPRLPWYQQRPFYIPKAGERMPEDVEDWEIVKAAWESDDCEEDEDCEPEEKSEEQSAETTPAG